MKPPSFFLSIPTQFQQTTKSLWHNVKCTAQVYKLSTGGWSLRNSFAPHSRSLSTLKWVVIQSRVDFFLQKRTQTYTLHQKKTQTPIGSWLVVDRWLNHCGDSLCNNSCAYLIITSSADNADDQVHSTATTLTHFRWTALDWAESGSRNVYLVIELQDTVWDPILSLDQFTKIKVGR